MFTSKSGFIFVFFGSILSSSSVFADTSPAEVLNESWDFVCPGTSDSGSDLEARCDEIGGGTIGGIEAGTGNNAGVSTGVGNSTTYLDRHHKKAIEERQEKLKKQGAAGDILSGERLGFFSSGKLTEIDRKDTVLETGYDSDVLGFTVGMDYIFSEKFVAGLAVGYSDTDLDYNGNVGSSDYESVSVLTYANFSVNDDFSIDGYLGWTGIDYDLTRNISYAITPCCNQSIPPVNTVANADATANKILAGLNFSYSLSYDALKVTPLIKLDYSGSFIDSYAESGGDGLALRYQDQNIQSFKSTLGFDTSYAVSVPWGVILPRVKAGYVHEFLDQRRTIHASFVQDATNYDLQFSTDKPDRDYFVIGGGISAVLTHSVQLFVDYQRVEGHRYFNSYTVSGGVRAAF